MTFHGRPQWPRKTDATRRVRPGLEVLEDRLVLSFTPAGSIAVGTRPWTVGTLVAVRRRKKPPRLKVVVRYADSGEVKAHEVEWVGIVCEGSHGLAPGFAR